MSKPRVLVVEDHEEICTHLKYALRDEFAVWFAADRPSALALLREVQPAVVSLDLGLPPDPSTATEGLQLLDDMVSLAPLAKVVVMTANGDRENALRALQAGAFDFQLKPIDFEQYRVMLRRAAYLHDLARDHANVQHANEKAATFEEIIGHTPVLRGIFTVIQRVAKTDATVVIEGESGTGKELIARAIHSRSARHDRPFVPINCGAIPETLLESELFGHERGAFTGAHAQRKGKFELADHGTLFLDEIGDLPLLLQVKLLRFFQQRIVERVGGREPIQLDLRIIAATNRDLKSQLERGLFREDLYYRLSVVKIQVPPLRERGEDIAVLANVFLQRATQTHRRRMRFGPDAWRALLAHPWPGNVRELENRVNRAVILARRHVIEPADLDLEAAPSPRPSSLRETRRRVEHEALIDSLTRHRGNVSRAALELKVSRPTLHGLLGLHGINAKDFR